MTRGKRKVISADIGSMHEMPPRVDSNMFQAYVEKMVLSAVDHVKADILVLDCLWYTRYLTRSRRERLLLWIKKAQILTKKFVLVPIVASDHWQLLVLVNFGKDKPAMVLFDSLHTLDPERSQPELRRFVVDAVRASGMDNSKDYVASIPLHIPKVPQQHGGDDCGYYVLYYIDLLCQGDVSFLEGLDEEPTVFVHWFTYEEFISFQRDVLYFVRDAKVRAAEYIKPKNLSLRARTMQRLFQQKDIELPLEIDIENLEAAKSSKGKEEAVEVAACENEEEKGATPSKSPAGEDELEVGNESSGRPRKKGRRGPTMCNKVQSRSLDKRQPIELNESNQPVGPTNKVCREFSSFLGTIVRSSAHCPLNYNDWRKIPDKESIWQYVLKKYIVPPHGRKWVLATIRANWRCYKCRLKKKFYSKYNTDRARLQNRPNSIPESQFQELLKLWSSAEGKEKSAKNKAICEKQKHMHSMGSKSFARIRHTMDEEGKATGWGNLPVN